MTIGPYQLSDTVRIPLEVTLNGIPIAVTNPRLQQLVLPDGTSASGFPQTMTRLKDGTYMYEFVATIVGNYIAIIQAELGSNTIEQIEPFVVGKPFGFPRIEVATDD